jgi:signal transduction histidine kinase
VHDGKTCSISLHRDEGGLFRQCTLVSDAGGGVVSREKGRGDQVVGRSVSVVLGSLCIQVGQGSAARGPVRQLGSAVFAAPGRYFTEVSLLAGLYYGSAQIGYQFGITGPVAGIVWLPVGVGISYLGLRGLRYWPGALIGDLLATNYSSLPLSAGIGQTAGNLLEVLLAAALVASQLRREAPLQSIRGVARTLGAIAAGTAVSAVIGPLGLVASGVLDEGSLPPVVRTWWLGDACGALIVVPFALTWFRQGSLAFLRARGLSLVLILSLVAVLGWVSTRGDGPITYLVFPALLVTAVLYGARGASAAIAVTSACAIWETTHRNGPFVYQSITHSILVTQVFIVVVSCSALLLAALVAERERVLHELTGARLDAVRAEYLERQRIERDLHDGIQQRLLALLIRLTRVKADESETEGLRAAVDEAARQVRIAMDEVRAISTGVFPPALTEVGLGEAVRDIAAGSGSHIPIVLVGVPSRRLDIATEVQAYFIVAESVTNAQKYSNATVIRVSIDATEGALRVVVSDDGDGGAHEKAGSGLAGLRQRTEVLGGSLTVESPPGAGTIVAASLPLGGTSSHSKIALA